MKLIKKIVVVAVFALLVAPITADAATMSIAINEYTGHGAKVYTSIEEYNGGLNVGIELISPDFADIRAFFATVANPSILSSNLSVSGTNVSTSSSSFIVNENSVTSVGDPSSPVEISSDGPNVPGPFDIGVEIGTPGTSQDDITMASFTLSNENGDLSLDNFVIESIGIILENVGDDENDRNEITELVAALPFDDIEEDNLNIFAGETLPDGGPESEIINVVNPEPTTVLLLGIGLAGMASVSLRRMRKNGTTKKA